MKRVGSWFDNEGYHVIVFNEDGSIFEHLLKPADEVTNEDLARAFKESKRDC